jgi:hypothetical protein
MSLRSASLRWLSFSGFNEWVAAGKESSSILGAGVHPFLRCSATTVVKMPPRTKNFAVSRMNRGLVAFDQVVEDSLVTASWNAPASRNDQM